jgi:hypothetical protein
VSTSLLYGALDKEHSAGQMATMVLGLSATVHNEFIARFGDDNTHCPLNPMYRPIYPATFPFQIGEGVLAGEVP